MRKKTHPWPVESILPSIVEPSSSAGLARCLFCIIIKDELSGRRGFPPKDWYAELPPMELCRRNECLPAQRREAKGMKVLFFLWYPQFSWRCALFSLRANYHSYIAKGSLVNPNTFFFGLFPPQSRLNWTTTYNPSTVSTKCTYIVPPAPRMGRKEDWMNYWFFIHSQQVDWASKRGWDLPWCDNVCAILIFLTWSRLFFPTSILA